MADVQRRLTTIVAADIAGFSRLVGTDEEGTLAAQRLHRDELIQPLLDEFHGRIANTAGDSFLLEFPSAVEAVRCALAVQEGMVARNSDIPSERQIQYRIGINVGDVVAEGNDLLGDGVNIAARLENLCEPGSIILSDDAYRQVRDRIDLHWEDGGEYEVKNITRPIRVWRLGPEAESKSATPSDTPLPLPAKPSIVVLPFDNLSNDAEQEFLADGLAEDITTMLSNLRWLFVVARNSAFTYKNQAVNITDVGRELGVHYVLEGSVRKAGDRIRVTAQLIEAREGNHIWADRYDRVLLDIFEIQDDITSNIVGMLETEISSAEQAASLQRPANLDAWAAYQRGMSGLGNHYEPEMQKQAITDFGTAIELDPKFAAAYAGLAVAQIQVSTWGGLNPDKARALVAVSLEKAKSAVRLDERDAWGYAALARSYLFSRDLAAARKAAQTALTLNRNSFQVLNAAAIVATFTGDTSTAFELLDEVDRISPRNPFRLVLGPMLRGQANLYLGRDTGDPAYFEAAVNSLEPAIMETPGLWPRLYRVVALQSLGREEDVKLAFADAQRLHPDFNAEKFRSISWVLPDRDFFDWFISVLESAGLPEA